MDKHPGNVKSLDILYAELGQQVHMLKFSLAFLSAQLQATREKIKTK